MLPEGERNGYSTELWSTWYGGPSHEVKQLGVVYVALTACSLSYPEKENVAFSSMSALCTAVEGGVTKQTGGYVKESSFEEKCEIVEGSRECREYEDPNTTELVDNQLDCTNVTDTEDISRTIFSENGSNDVKAVVSSEHSKHCDNNGIYARQITEPLRPLNTSAPSTRLPQDVGVESVAVVGEHEEQITLFFRPVQEELQKKWCLRFGLQYVGTPDLRKHTFGRELEFSLRDTPQSCEVRGDGNCLFRTLCWWITGGSEIHHFLLREKLISFMSKYRSKFTSFLQSQQDMDNHLLRMSEDGEWGTQVELAAAACWLGVNIYTFLEGKWLKYRPLFRWSNDGSAPARRSLRSRKEKDLIKVSLYACVVDSAYLSLITEPPYVFNSADGPVYSLSAVICHHGDSLLSGHYSTFALDVARQEWLDCNDNIITKVSEAEVMDNSSSSGYIFIYNRLEDPYSRL
ncbi:OTU-like cysteine protease [Dictyocaulus viviparus]|uniref:OTU-like cysteine protease n=1 Tax=Dictyocaulus viviparus TaxID=29172 RepID=A0A0D8Y7E2_DICVI|nr:OTU-like cysteine protease [Dictyocaulus viviparus]